MTAISPEFRKAFASVYPGYRTPTVAHAYRVACRRMPDFGASAPSLNQVYRWLKTDPASPAATARYREISRQARARQSEAVLRGI